MNSCNSFICSKGTSLRMLRPWNTDTHFRIVFEIILLLKYCNDYTPKNNGFEIFSYYFQHDFLTSDEI